MTRYGLTVDEALPKIMELVRIRPEDVIFRRELRTILNRVRSDGYHDGCEDERSYGE